MQTSQCNSPNCISPMCRILACGHSFGSECIENMISQQQRVVCPLCSKEHCFPDGVAPSTQAIARNIFLCELMEQLPPAMLDQAPAEAPRTCLLKCLSRRERRLTCVSK
jgi:hypothetical protein